MQYAEDGSRRIRQEIEDDPAERQRLRRGLERVREIFGHTPGVKRGRDFCGWRFVAGRYDGWGRGS
ncbi:MAG: hypothetical protein GVY24_06395 [Planctomycetes bacterium]|nr:hypothetical protein [Planctomycetota bacterium]